MSRDPNVKSYHGCTVEAVEVAGAGPAWGFEITTPDGKRQSWLGIASRRSSRRAALQSARHKAKALTSPGGGAQLELPYEVT